MASHDSAGHQFRNRLVGITSQPRMVIANASKTQSHCSSNLLDTHTVSPYPFCPPHVQNSVTRVTMKMHSSLLNR
jgi:hypothetical protein